MSDTPGTPPTSAPAPDARRSDNPRVQAMMADVEALVQKHLEDAADASVAQLGSDLMAAVAASIKAAQERMEQESEAFATASLDPSLAPYASSLQPGKPGS